jgi:hypothetical protein
MAHDRTAGPSKASGKNTLPRDRDCRFGDKLMIPFRKTHPDFYSGYLVARVIVDRRATQKPAAPAPPSP